MAADGNNRRLEGVMPDIIDLAGAFSGLREADAPVARHRDALVSTAFKRAQAIPDSLSMDRSGETNNVIDVRAPLRVILASSRDDQVKGGGVKRLKPRQSESVVCDIALKGFLDPEMHESLAVQLKRRMSQL